MRNRLLYTSPLRMLLAENADNKKNRLFNQLRDEGLLCSWPVFLSWFEDGRTTFDVEINAFPSLVNSTKIPYDYYTDEETSKTVTKDSVVPAEKWFPFIIDLQGFGLYMKNRKRGYLKAAKALGIDRETFSKIVGSPDYIIQSRIMTSRVLSWLHYEKGSGYIHGLRSTDNIDDIINQKYAVEDFLTSSEGQSTEHQESSQPDDRTFSVNDSESIFISNQIIQRTNEVMSNPEIDLIKKIDTLTFFLLYHKNSLQKKNTEQK